MASTTKKYLDLAGLKYVLSKLANTTPTGDVNGVVTGVTQSNGIISVEKSLISSDNLSTDLQGEIVKSVALGSTTSGEITTITLTPTLLSGATGTTSDVSITVPAASVTGATGFLKVENKNVVLDTTKVQGGKTESIDSTTTKLASQLYVDEAVAGAVTKAVVYKGAVTALPTEGMANGDMYKLTVTISAPVSAKVGDTVIYNGTTWDVIPSGDDIEYTGVIVDGTKVIDATQGGDVTFAAGDKLDVTGAAGTVTYSHATMVTDQSAEKSDLYKVSVDKFGHVTLGDKVDVDSIAASKVNALNGSAVVVDAQEDNATSAATATTTTFYNVKQTNGVIEQDDAAVVFQTITEAEIDEIFKKA